MDASASLTVARAAGAARCRISRLRSEPPMVLRPTGPAPTEPPRRWNLDDPSTTRVALVAGAAGPVGGDHLRLDVEVGRGATVVLRGVAATLVLPGPHGQPSRTDVTIRVAADATMLWLPGPLIAARSCDHQATTRIMLEPGARLLAREELILGRYGEPPGAVRQRLRVCLGDQPLHDQETRFGARAPGWDGPAVIGGRRAVGSLLVVDPVWTDAGPVSRPVTALSTDTVRLPLSGPAVVLTALAPDALVLRHRLDAALAAIDEPGLVAGATGSATTSRHGG